MNRSGCLDISFPIYLADLARPTTGCCGTLKAMDSRKAALDVIRLLSREQHNVLLFEAWIDRIAEIFRFLESTWYGIPNEMKKWNISATHSIQILKNSTLCCSRKSTLMTSKAASRESIAFRVPLLPAVGRARSAKYAKWKNKTARSIQGIPEYTSLDYFLKSNTMRYFSRLESNELGFIFGFGSVRSHR